MPRTAIQAAKKVHRCEHACLAGARSRTATQRATDYAAAAKKPAGGFATAVEPCRRSRHRSLDAAAMKAKRRARDEGGPDVGVDGAQQATKPVTSVVTPPIRRAPPARSCRYRYRGCCRRKWPPPGAAEVSRVLMKSWGRAVKRSQCPLAGV